MARRSPLVELRPSDRSAPPIGKVKPANLLAQIKQDFVSLNGYDIYADRFDMVGAAREIFREIGVEEAHLYGDAFAFNQ